MRKKIAVYAICKNEEQFVKRFMASIKNEADMIIVADTGSTDNTIKLLKEEGAIVHEIKVDPWRFDAARNISLSFVPHDVDICVCIDLDEVLSPGWRKGIEDSWKEDTTRLRYQYTWSFNSDGTPGVTFWYDKIHLRHGYQWVKPVHEVLQYEGEEKQDYCHTIQLYHFPDNTKSRGSYLSLLELGCNENPHDDRSAHYLGREYMYYKEWDKSISELSRHLSLPSAQWKAERAASMRFIAKCYSEKGDFKQAENWAMQSCIEDPDSREPWIELGKVYYYQQKWHGVFYAITQALSIEERPMSYICEPESWGGAPYDYISIAALNLGMKEKAIEYCKKALEYTPSDSRLVNNLILMTK